MYGLKVDCKPLKSVGVRKQDKIIVLLKNQVAVIGPEWWAMKEARNLACQYGSKLDDAYETKVRVNRVVTSLNKLLENLEFETHE